ncbi:MAG: hypothetical protein ACOCRX_08165 [Candidatus Woesearchaeota archaeon]
MKCKSCEFVNKFEYSMIINEKNPVKVIGYCDHFFSPEYKKDVCNESGCSKGKKIKIKDNEIKKIINKYINNKKIKAFYIELIEKKLKKKYSKKEIKKVLDLYVEKKVIKEKYELRCSNCASILLINKDKSYLKRLITLGQ